MKVLSVEIGYLYTKVCELDYKTKNPKVYNSFVLPTPEGVVADGMFTMTEEFVADFKAKLLEYKIKTKKVVFTVASSKIATREVKVVYCKENRIADMVRANLGDYFPVDINQYEVAHSILSIEGAELDDKGRVKKGTTPTGYKLLLLAAPKQILDGYRLFAKALALELEGIDYNGNSVYQVSKETCSEGTQLVMKVDERGTLVLVVRDGQIVLNRSIPYGVEDAIHTIMDTQHLGAVSDFEKALLLARSEKCIVEPQKESRTPDEEADGGEEAENTATAPDAAMVEKMRITGSLAALSGGINRVIDYYNSTHSDSPIDRMYVTGLGADFVGMDEYLSAVIGHPVAVLKNLTGINLEKSFVGVAYGEYAACVGAAIAPTRFYSNQMEQGESKAALNVDPMRIAVIVAGGCVFISVALLITSLIPYLSEKKKKKEYETTISELQPVYDTYLSYQALQTKLENVTALDKTTENRNRELVELIENLEKSMPKSFCLNDLTATSIGVTMNVTVETKEEAASVLNELSKLKYFYFVDTTALTELITETGEEQYSFAIDMTYAPIVDEEETTEEVEE